MKYYNIKLLIFIKHEIDVFITTFATEYHPRFGQSLYLSICFYTCLLAAIGLTRDCPPLGIKLGDKPAIEFGETPPFASLSFAMLSAILCQLG